jgi:hypothetical protein
VRFEIEPGLSDKINASGEHIPQIFKNLDNYIKLIDY